MRVAFLLAPILALSACGARTDLLFGSDAGSTQPASTFTGTSASLAPSGGYGIETVTGTAPATGTYTATFVDVSTPTGTSPTTITGTSVDISSASCIISASNYDQSCTTDDNCVVVPFGDFCGPSVPGGIDCSGSISMAGMGAYNAAVSKTSLAQEGIECGVSTPPCCRQGQCTTNCLSASDTLPACAMAGGTCIYAPPTETPPCQRIVVSASAPACAKADEVCCVGAILPR